jgi:hypothetical protein
MHKMNVIPLTLLVILVLAVSGDTGNLSRFARRRFPTCPCQIPDADAGNRRPRARCIRGDAGNPNRFARTRNTHRRLRCRNSHWYANSGVNQTADARPHFHGSPANHSGGDRCW